MQKSNSKSNKKLYDAINAEQSMYEEMKARILEQRTVTEPRIYIFEFSFKEV